MPEMRTYTVTQTREVKVSANTAVDAARIANLAFSDPQGRPVGTIDVEADLGVWGNSDRVRTTGINAQENRP